MRRAMIFTLITLVLLAGLVGGLWFAWKHGFAGEQALPGPLGEVQEHLRREGIPTHARLVQRGQWRGARLHAQFELANERGQLFHIVWFDTPQDAERQRQALLVAARPSHPQVRGPLMLYLTEWPADAPATRRVIDAFLRWPG
jgi:hypothetical protein